MAKISKNKKYIAIVSCCIDDWGGSEELWARSIPYLKEQGYGFTVYKETVNYNHPEIKNLIHQGVAFKEIKDDTTLLKKLKKKATEVLFKQKNPIRIYSSYNISFKQNLINNRPSFVIIAQGINFDGLGYAYQCLQLNIPYCLIIQKAVDFFWPPTHERPYMVEVFQKAKKCYFVSHQNKQLTEEQFGIRLTNAEVVWNPIKIKPNPVPYPNTENGYNIACVGRLFIIDKGQDILLRILAKEPWKSRPITISFIGSGTDEKGIKELAQLLDITNINFVGFVNNIESIWQSYHALILPSRSEGMALSVLEAMACGRIVITTTAGGHAEIINHQVNGFIGNATEKDFEKTMEAAWDLHETWENIGLKAYTDIIEKIPVLPEKEFANTLTKVLNES